MARLAHEAPATVIGRRRAEQARAMLYDADPHNAVMLACDLLVAGVDPGQPPFSHGRGRPVKPI